MINAQIEMRRYVDTDPPVKDSQGNYPNDKPPWALGTEGKKEFADRFSGIVMPFGFPKIRLVTKTRTLFSLKHHGV